MLAVVAAGCSSEHKAAGRSKELFELKVPTSTSISNLFVAEQKGFMAEEGLKIKEVGVLALSMYYPALIRGDIDIAGGHPDGLARAIMGGVKIKGIAPGIVDHPQFQHQLYLVKADSPIRTAKDLIGKKVGVSLINGCADGILIDWLIQNNVPRNKVTFVILPDVQQEQSLRQGLIDVATLHPAYYKGALNHGGLRKLVDSWEIVRNPSGGTSFGAVVTEKFLQEHPDTARSLVRAVLKANRWINEHQEETVEMFAKKLKFPIKNVSTFHFDDNALIVDERITPWFERMKRAGEKMPLKPSDIYTNEYNDAYHKQASARP
jgi:ABC-type nitrate/sulfonate/bicarbonate transport system substrate-binding protein